jgi:hypothetical protein
MVCPHCQAENPPNARFCKACGKPLVAAPPDAGQPAAAPPPRPPTTTSGPSGTVGLEAPPLARPPAPLPPTLFSQTPPPASPPAVYAPARPPQTFEPLGALNIWGPFAGFGTRRRHVGWLMDGKGEHAQNLSQKVGSRFANRQIPGARLTTETLVAKGLLVEQRPYYILRRNLVSLGLYISNYGRDLFVSLVSYLKPPLSNLRLLLLGGSVVFAFFYARVYPGMVQSAFNTMLLGVQASFGDLLFGEQAAIVGLEAYSFLLCCLGPLGLINYLALTFFGLFSIYKWITEKDLLAGLRVPPNEFNEDDLMALEKAVEQTVRAAIDEIGLDPNDLKPIAGPDSRRLI